MEYKQLQLISPKEFKEQFCPQLSVNTVRDLFHAEGFPAAQIGERMYTTSEAACRWLSCIGQDWLLNMANPEGKENNDNQS